MEEDELRYYEAVEKVRETISIRIIINEILCFFLLQKLHIILAPLSYSPCMVESPGNIQSRQSVTPSLGLYVTTIRIIWAYRTNFCFKQ